jgi:hypothetical protein
MPIKTDYVVEPRWFRSHTPFDLTDIILAEDINQMISYDVESLSMDSPLTLEYPLGVVQTGYLFRIIFKNLTENSILKITAEFNKRSLKLLRDDDSLLTFDEIILNRAETKSIRIFLQTDEFNSYDGDIEIDTLLKISVSHMANGDVVKKDQTVIPLNKKDISSIKVT